MTVTQAPNVAAAVETVASHLHPTPSFAVEDHPVPTGREEVWRFTPLARLRPLLDAAPTGARLDRVETLSAGVTIRTISAEEARALVVEAPIDRPSAIAVANDPDGATLVDVPAGAEVDPPVVLTLTGRSERVNAHTVFRVGAHARATIVVRHEGSAQYASKVDVRVGDGAKVDFVSVQDWADDALHAGHHAFLVGRDAHLRTVTVSLGGSVVRLSETARYDGPGGTLEQFGLYFVDAGQHIEHRLFVDHDAPHTTSNVDYRGALQGAGAHSVWVGDVLIRKVAEGIETYEANKNLVLTDGCRADSVPNLEIETGEILGAGHSSTTGRFDDEQLFYLMARGIDADEAKRLVVHGFFADIIRRIGVPQIEAQMMEALERELAVTVGSPS